MKNILNEFKKFAVRGSVIDLAVGIIIGGAFNRIVTSLVNDIIMPPIGLLLGKVDFANRFVPLGDGEFETLAAAKEAGVPTINYGLFINEIVGFVLTAVAVFLLIRFINKVKDRQSAAETPAAPVRKCPYCRTAVDLEAVKCPACASSISMPAQAEAR